MGLRTERQRQEPLCRCDSLDAPLDAEDNGSATRGDTVPDAAAEQAFNDADECLYTAQLHSALDDALLPCWMNGRPLCCVADSMRAARWKVWPCSWAYPANVSGKQNQKPFAQCAFHGSSASWKRTGKTSLRAASYHGTGFTAWKERGSVEERLAERIEAYAERGTTNAFISDVMRIRGCSREEVLQRYPELSS